MRAIACGALTASRGNQGWQIDSEDLAVWAGAHARADAQAQPDAQPAPTAAEAALIERIRGLELLLAEMRTDRDRWHALAIRPWWRRLAG